MIKVHGVSASPFVRKVLAVMAIKELPFEHLPQMPFTDDPEFRKISPLGKVPALEDGDLVVNDSKVICQYLEDAYPEPPVYPTDIGQKTRARWYEELGGTRIAELAAGIFFQRFMRPVMLKQEADEALVENLINNKLPPMLDYLESQVPAEGFIFGELGVADIALVSPFVNASYAGYTVDSERWPGFSAFYRRVVSHAVMAPLLEADAKALGLAP
ncbi:glutathione S-transferase family protein [Seongchinamella sediminis]|uniref:Glutathione S-transferase family protein n=1 Tax=Seongchinamella sediminis TaxID=2283635 RepID=A0A3L7E196_9GAMM|nr:glutathione S-transferase family protein [Seongchinamella sediminis]RLQ22635.1 glutathione S-transferase family protein [Seongchinamella sediminis]